MPSFDKCQHLLPWLFVKTLLASSIWCLSSMNTLRVSSVSLDCVVVDPVAHSNETPWPYFVHVDVNQILTMLRHIEA